MTNKYHTVFYTGVSGDLPVRAHQHRNKLVEGFTKKYRVTKLVYFEATEDVHGALEREKQIKAGSRQKKVELIESLNPDFLDLYDYITGKKEWDGPGVAGNIKHFCCHCEEVLHRRSNLPVGLNNREIASLRQSLSASAEPAMTTNTRQNRKTA
jgi:putative endonuclease